MIMSEPKVSTSGAMPRDDGHILVICDDGDYLESPKTLLSPKNEVKIEINALFCRVCLQEGNIPIYGDDTHNNVSEDLNALACINVQEDDELPKHLCMKCNMLLHNAMELKMTAQYSDQILQAEGFNRQHFPAYSINSLEESKWHSADTTETVATFTYYKVPGLQKITPKISLDKCDQDAKNIDVTWKRSGTKTKHSQLNKVKTTKIRLKKVIRKSKIEMVKLESVKPIKKFECKVCHIYFQSKLEYKEHRQSEEHKNKNKEACPICNKMYGPQYLKTHLEFHKKEFAHICDICGKGCSLKKLLVVHRRIHSLELPFKCPQCPYRGRDGYSLRKHQQRRHTNVKPYQCPHCPRKCSTKSNLNQHTLTHKTEKDFKCNECQRGFHRKTDLEQHFKSDHLGIKEHVCDVCSKAFGTRTRMMKHKQKVHKRPKSDSGRTPLYILAEQNP